MSVIITDEPYHIVPMDAPKGLKIYMDIMYGVKEEAYKSCAIPAEINYGVKVIAPVKISIQINFKNKNAIDYLDI